jgi:hypothetical protein
LYKLNERLEPARRTYIGDPEIIRAAVEKAASSAIVKGSGE